MSKITKLVINNLMPIATTHVKGKLLNMGKKHLLTAATKVIEKELMPKTVEVTNNCEKQAEIDRLTTEVHLIEEALKPQVIELTELSRIMYGIKGKQTDETLAANKQYYALLKVTKDSRRKMHELLGRIREIKQTIPVKPTMTKYAIELEEKRAIKEACVTSSTYERAKNRLTKSVDGFLSGRIRNSRF